MKNLKRSSLRPVKVPAGQLAARIDPSSLIEEIKEVYEILSKMDKMETIEKKKRRHRGRKEMSISSPEFIEHETIVKMEPKDRFRVKLQIREFRKAEPPRIAEPEVLIDG